MTNLVDLKLQGFSVHSLRLEMRRNTNKGNSEITYWFDNTRFKLESKRHNKECGKKAAFYKNQVDKKAKIRMVSMGDFNAVRFYEDFLSCNMPPRAMEQMAPQIRAVNNKFYSDTWDRLWAVRGKLRPGVGELFDIMQNLHCLHICLENRKQVAFYPTYEHKIKGREVRTTLGKYLTAYKEVLDLSESEIKGLADYHVMNITAADRWKLNFIEHDNPQGWVDVYSNGPQSCMRSSSSVRVYAHSKSVLRLAYVIGDNDSIVARAIVRDDSRNGYLRVYPDPQGSPEGKWLLEELVKQGYGEEIDLDGVLLQAISEGRRYVCPYLDSGYSGTQRVKYIDGYLLCGEGVDASNQSGYSDNTEPEERCERCGCGVDDEYELTYIESEERRVCGGCLENHYVAAESCYGTEYVPEDEATFCQSDVNWYLTDQLSEFDIYQCEATGEYYFRRDLISVLEGYILEKFAVAIDLSDRDGNLWANEGSVETLSDGRTCHEDDFEAYQTSIDEEYLEEQKIQAQADLDKVQMTFEILPTITQVRESLISA